MGHYRHADFVGNLQCNVERHGSRAARRAGTDAHLDTDDQIAIGACNLHRIDWRHKTDFFAFSYHHTRREGVDAGKGDMQIGEDADLAALD